MSLPTSEFKDLEDKYPLTLPRPRKYISRHCEVGWLPLLDRLCAKIEPLIHALPESDRSRFYNQQIKEKFGGLRFYMSYATDDMYALIAEAERESHTICEFCGETGETRRDLSWLKTLCDKHYQEKKNGSE